MRRTLSVRRSLAAAAAVTAAALTLAACGTTESPSDGKDTSGQSGGKITLTGVNGKKAELDGPAKKVVATEWNGVEDLVALGVTPAGVADVKGYRNWGTAAPLKGDPKDIGTRGEPSMDAIASLSPDLVIATTDLPASAVKQMRKIAPVLETRPADGSDQIGRMKANLDLLAKATGRTKQAEQLKKDFDAKLAEGRKTLADKGLDGKKIAFGDGYSASNQVTIRPYTDRSLIGAVNKRLGLKNAWTQKGDKTYGLASTDVEGLTGLGDVPFVYIGNKKDSSSNPFTKELAGNATWKSLPFVKSGNVHRLPDGIWMFGGTSSMGAYVDALVKSLTK